MGVLRCLNSITLASIFFCIYTCMYVYKGVKLVFPNSTTAAFLLQLLYVDKLTAATTYSAFTLLIFTLKSCCHVSGWKATGNKLVVIKNCALFLAAHILFGWIWQEGDERAFCFTHQSGDRPALLWWAVWQRKRSYNLIVMILVSLLIEFIKKKKKTTNMVVLMVHVADLKNIKCILYLKIKLQFNFFK